MFSVDDALVKSTLVARKMDQPPTLFRDCTTSENPFKAFVA
jgi:hypothetical protein